MRKILINAKSDTRAMYTAEVFEKAMNSCGYILDRIIHTKDSRNVLKVEGRINIPKRITISGERKIIICQKKFRWDDAGRCFSFRSHIRKRNLDLPINTILEYQKQREIESQM